MTRKVRENESQQRDYKSLTAEGALLMTLVLIVCVCVCVCVYVCVCALLRAHIPFKMLFPECHHLLMRLLTDFLCNYLTVI